MKYRLENNELKVEFDTFGGEITSIQDCDGIEYLWQKDKTYWGGQAPVLFPIVGSLRDKKAVIGGNRSCFMERHGVVRKLEFDMEEKTEDAITFSVCSNDETKARYHYDFKLKIQYKLAGKNITTGYIVENRNDIEMPFQIGGHPAFNCPLRNGEHFEDYVVEFEQAETADCPTPVPSTGLVDVEKRTRVLNQEKTIRMSHDLFRVDALIFDQLKSRKAKLVNPKTKGGVQVTFPDFNNLLIWSSANGGPFVALEPWSGLSTCSDESDIFVEKRGVYRLPAGNTKQVSFVITILN